MPAPSILSAIVRSVPARNQKHAPRAEVGEKTSRNKKLLSRRVTAKTFKSKEKYLEPSPLPATLELNHLSQTAQDIRRDFAAHSNEVTHRKTKPLQRLFVPAALLRCAVSEELHPSPCEVRDHTG